MLQNLDWLPPQLNQICGRMLVQGFTHFLFFVLRIHHNHDAMINPLLYRGSVWRMQKSP